MAKLITIKQSTFDKAINALNKEKKELRDLLELSRNRSNELYDLLQTMRGKLAQSEKEKERLQTLITQSIKCL
jgi:prefoldin subunit 5